jgi:hypothetical protein
MMAFILHWKKNTENGDMCDVHNVLFADFYRYFSPALYLPALVTNELNIILIHYQILSPRCGQALFLNSRNIFLRCSELTALFHHLLNRKHSIA